MASKMTPAKLTSFLLLGVGLLVAVYVGKKVFAKEEVQEPPVARRNVPMTVGDLEPGTVITTAHIGTGPILVTDLEPDMLLNNRVILGRVVKKAIKAASPIRADSLYEVNEFPSLELKEGKQALAVSVGDNVSILDGLIKPGEYVDVRFSPELPDIEAAKGGMVITLLKGIRVIAVNRNFTHSPLGRGNNTVVLEVTPRESNTLILARSRGAITLTPNPNGAADNEINSGDPDRVFFNEMLGLPEPPEPEEPEVDKKPALPYVTETYSGSSLGFNHFSKDAPHRRTDPQGYYRGRTEEQQIRRLNPRDNDPNDYTEPQLPGPNRSYNLNQPVPNPMMNAVPSPQYRNLQQTPAAPAAPGIRNPGLAPPALRPTPVPNLFGPTI